MKPIPSPLSIALLISTGAFTSAEAAAPVQVFILAGQSNMEGKAAAYTLDAVIANPATRARFEHLKPGGEWLVRDDVFVTFLDRSTKGGGGGLPTHGQLTVGFGGHKQGRDENNKRVNLRSVGPELGIGQVLGDHFGAPVLLIKAAWGGRAVRYSFRPPGAMPSDEQIRAEVAAINARREAQIERQKVNLNPKRKPKPPPPAATFEARKAGYGSDYRKILGETARVLEDLPAYVPGYRPAQGYKIAGFIWFQGWNDAIGDGNPDYVDQMAHFIRDIRRDLVAPGLPFVIGELGTDGPGAGGWIATFRAQQRAIAALDEFKGTVKLAPTAPYWPTGLPDLSAQWAEFRALAKANEAKPKDDPSRIDPGLFYQRNWEQKYRAERAYTSDKRYHYLGSGACYYQMGESMGRAMVDLIEGR